MGGGQGDGGTGTAGRGGGGTERDKYVQYSTIQEHVVSLMLF
jgi:hypothetical protein